MNYPTDISVLPLLPARCATGAHVPVQVGVTNVTGEGAGGAHAPRDATTTGNKLPVEQATASFETVEPAIYCADCGDELDEPDILCASCAEELADVAHGERIAELERELAATKRELLSTQQSLIQARKVILDQQLKIQRLLPATPPPPVPESDLVRFVTLRPSDTLARLSGQQRVEDLLAAGWQVHSMTALPGDLPAIVVLLTNPARLPAAPSRPAFVPRRRASALRAASAAVNDHRDDTRTYVTGVSEPLILNLHDNALTYADAVRAPRGTFTDAELADIANREVQTAARRAHERAGDPTLPDVLARLNTRRAPDAAQQ